MSLADVGGQFFPPPRGVRHHCWAGSSNHSESTWRPHQLVTRQSIPQYLHTTFQYRSYKVNFTYTLLLWAISTQLRHKLHGVFEHDDGGCHQADIPTTLSQHPLTCSRTSTYEHGLTTHSLCAILPQPSRPRHTSLITTLVTRVLYVHIALQHYSKL